MGLLWGLQIAAGQKTQMEIESSVLDTLAAVRQDMTASKTYGVMLRRDAEVEHLGPNTGFFLFQGK
tara:strand:- start:1585 stop:1782 length:198 start_codon:yes stop_codon:yes gene_type:complete